MAEAAKDQDQSMEDILQSIKRIIAEEGDPVESASGSDVLELTEQLAEDGSITRIKPEEAASVPQSLSIEDIMAAPISSLPPVEEPKPAPAPVPAPVAEVQAVPAPAPVELPAPAAPAVDDSLLSGATLSASVAALNALRDSMTPQAAAPRISAGSFRSGTTVEDLVVESLKPMLKEWLDTNLPSMVEALVKKEISKLTQG
jgi:cell pole-organizing protein PopZ